MSTVIRYAAAMACVVLASTASAQDLLLAGSRTFGAVGQFGADLGPALQVSEESVFGGARFAASWEGWTNTVTVLDGRSAQPSAFAGYLLAVDRARPHLFVARVGGILGIDVVSRKELLLWPGQGDRVQQCAHAESPNRLYCTVARMDGLSDVVAIDVTTKVATTLSALPLPGPSQTSRGGSSVWKTTSDGRRVYFVSAAGTLSMLDTTTAAVVTSGITPVTDIGRPEMMRLDAVTGRVIAFGADDAIHVLGEDLALLGSTAAPATCNNVATSPHTGRLYLARFNLLSQCPRCGGGTSNVTFEALDATTYASLASPVTPPTIFPWEYTCSLTVLSAPGPPRDVAATVSGSDLTLGWTNVGSASGFVLDVGVASGRTDLQIHVGPDTTFRAAGVPPGTYYLRIRGGNELGGGRPSSEVRVVVPAS